MLKPVLFAALLAAVSATNGDELLYEPKEQMERFGAGGFGFGEPLENSTFAAKPAEKDERAAEQSEPLPETGEDPLGVDLPIGEELREQNRSGEAL